ncbi:MAG: hypothetical protein ABSG01_16475 [Anaerolineales bacterium]|jgi:hypothetical protein
MEGNLDEIEPNVKEELETIKLLDNLFTKIKIILGIAGIVGLLIAAIIWLK